MYVVELSLFVQYCTCISDTVQYCTRVRKTVRVRVQAVHVRVHVHVQYGSFFLCVSCLFVVRFMCVYSMTRIRSYVQLYSTYTYNNVYESIVVNARFIQ